MTDKLQKIMKDYLTNDQKTELLQNSYTLELP